MFGGLEKTCGETRWRFGGDVFGDLEKAYSAISERPVRRFGENVWRFWRKPFGDFGENGSAILEIWRTLFGKIVVGDLEKSFGDFVLELVMEHRNAWRPYVVIEK